MVLRVRAVPGKPRLQSFADTYGRPEKLCGANSLYCLRREAAVPSAERIATLAALPDSLVFQVGRIDRATGCKVDVNVGAPSELYLGESQYALYGAVRRNGKHFACGHYVAVVNVGGGPGAWVCFDDETHYRINAAFAKQSRSPD